jgi:hypothetical protein
MNGGTPQVLQASHGYRKHQVATRYIMEASWAIPAYQRISRVCLTVEEPPRSKRRLNCVFIKSVPTYVARQRTRFHCKQRAFSTCTLLLCTIELEL